MRGHIQRRGKSSWRLKWELPAAAADGQRPTRYKTVRGTRKQADAALARILGALQDGSYVDPTAMTVADLLIKWRDDVAAHDVSAKTYERYAEHIARAIEGLGALKLMQLSPLHIQGFYSELRTRGHRRRDGGLSEQTLQHIHKVLKAALGQAVRWRLIARNPADDVKAPRPARRELVTLGADDMRRLLAVAAGTALATPILLWLTTGLRRGELLGLKWADLDRERGRLTVARTLEQTKAGGLVLKAPKTQRSSRVVPLPDVALAALHDHEVRQKQCRLALGPQWSANDLMFPDATGALCNPRNVTKLYGQLARQAGVPDRTIHGLRHTHITELLRAGVHPKVVSERAGHASVAFTLQRYAHALPDMQADAAHAAEKLVGALVRG